MKGQMGLQSAEKAQSIHAAARAANAQSRVQHGCPVLSLPGAQT